MESAKAMFGLAAISMRDTKHELFALHLTGADSTCGCPVLCVGDTLQVQQNDMFLAPELSGIYSLEDFKRFANEMNVTLHNTLWPVLPCLFTHFCIPFSPICAMAYCNSKRIRLLRELLKDESKRLACQGLYWEFLTVAINVPVAVLKLNPQARLNYEAEHPHARRLVRPGMMEEGVVYPGDIAASMAMQQRMVGQPIIMQGMQLPQSMGAQLGQPVSGQMVQMGHMPPYNPMASNPSAPAFPNWVMVCANNPEETTI
eukprot:GILK01015284.1.p1 GENE.GILK01015284.1~~GILK01015284.1.p1  ORF type:complete len:258 (+),score=22.09 GILK01015284.1:29-802(+)